MKDEVRYTLPSALVISAYAEPLIEAFRTHQVVIVCGDTGSGKTTQLPKLVAMAHPEARGWIGVTQPRRLATVAMARRLAEELESPLGAKVGYQHRFETRMSPSTRFKFMTDGILLAERREDPLFKRYHTIIVDEAHERSLNIDFLLGLLKGILPKRRDLRVVISSATLDAERFSTFFDHAPVVTVPGRLFPIDVEWMGDEMEGADDLPRRVGKAVDWVGPDSGDILVFLPGERDIREVMGFLEGRRLPRTECLPLLASLPAGEQSRVFQRSDKRRIILATNVAETSVTIPNIRVVIDSGVARIKRYSAQRRLQTLRVEAISQASARQRMGRCGRVGPGVCIRLYREEDYARREAYTAPEIKRSALAGVILTMADLGLGKIESFPFLDPPSGVAIREGYRELLELGALQKVPAKSDSKEDMRWRLTGMGRALAAFPLEPRFARILLAAEAEQSLRDALTVVAAMACDEPLLRPFERAAEADQQHARFKSTVSDFNARLKLWAWWNDAALGTSETQRRKRCKAAFISYPKMREWANIRQQLEQLCKQRSLHVEDAQGGEVGLHRALLCGLLSRIGHFDSETKEYRGAFGVRFAIFPGSGLARERREKSSPSQVRRRPRPDELPTSREWVLAGEVVETSRLFARNVACIDPRWIEPIAGPLCRVHRHNAFWDGERGFVRVHEEVSLFGLLLASGRIRDLTRLDPEAARRFFIADALCVPGAIRHAPQWLQANWKRQALLEQLFALQRNERDGLREALIAFYEASLPADVCNAHTLMKRCPPLPLKGRAFEVEEVTLRDFPQEMEIGGKRFPLSYVHAPRTAEDGVTIEVTPETLHLLRHWHGEWLVPGLLPEKIMWLLNALPSRVRHVLGPLLEVQSLILSRVVPYRRPLAETLYTLLRDERGVRVDDTVWEEGKLPDHLRLNYRVVDGEKVLGQGRNLETLIELFATEQAVVAPKAATVADPALARLLNRKECLEAFREMGGSRWTMYSQFPSLTPTVKAFVQRAEIDVARMGREMLMRAIEETFLKEAEDPRSPEEVEARYRACKQQLPYHANALRRQLVYILGEVARLEAMVSTMTGIYPETGEDILDQLAWLVYDGFVGTTPMMWLERYPLILQAIGDRLERARNNPAGDRKKLAMVQPAWERYTQFVTLAKRPRHDARLLNAYRWAVESLRMGSFNPTLQPFERTSAQKLERLWESIMAV